MPNQQTPIMSESYTARALEYNRHADELFAMYLRQTSKELGADYLRESQDYRLRAIDALHNARVWAVFERIRDNHAARFKVAQ